MSASALAPRPAVDGRARPVRRPSAYAGAPTRPTGPRRDIVPEQERRCRPPRPTRAGCASGPSASRRAAVRRRRLVLGTVATGLLVALALPWSGTGGHALTTPGPAPAGPALSAGSTYVVQPGDTLWSIAVRMDPSGDPRPVVARLAADVGGDTVVPGERLVLP